MAKAQFASILDQPASEDDRLRPAPEGSYLAAVQGQPLIDKSTGEAGTEFVEFTFKLIEPLDDVDEEALTEMGGLKNMTLKSRFWITPKAIFRLNNFLDHCHAGNKKDTRRQRLAETQGKEVVLYIKHEPSRNNPDQVFARVVGTAPAD